LLAGDSPKLACHFWQAVKTPGNAWRFCSYQPIKTRINNAEWSKHSGTVAAAAQSNIP
jgi:hypothetical protein